MDLDFKDYYTALGVASNADEATIKQAYRALQRARAAFLACSRPRRE